MNTAKKTERMEETPKKFSINDCEHCVAIPGADNVLNIIHPTTGRTVYSDKTLYDALMENPDAVVMTIDAFCKQKAERQHTPIVWEPSTYEAFDYGLNVLPPAIWLGNAFMVGEPCDCDAGSGQERFQAFRQRGEGVSSTYEKASRPMTKDEFRQEVKA